MRWVTSSGAAARLGFTRSTRPGASRMGTATCWPTTDSVAKVDEMEDLNIVYARTNSGRYYRSRLGRQSAQADEAATRAALADKELGQLE